MGSSDMAATEAFDISDLDAADTADMVVMAFGKPTSWIWTFSGPAHPKTVKQSDRLTMERIATEKMERQAQVNSKKYKVPEETVEERRANNVNFIVERLVGWSAVNMNGEPFPFSEANARAVLADRRKIDAFQQALDFLNAETSFMKRSATS